MHYDRGCLVILDVDYSFRWQFDPPVAARETSVDTQIANLTGVRRRCIGRIARADLTVSRSWQSSQRPVGRRVRAQFKRPKLSGCQFAQANGREPSKLIVLVWRYIDSRCPELAVRLRQNPYLSLHSGRATAAPWRHAAIYQESRQPVAARAWPSQKSRLHRRGALLCADPPKRANIMPRQRCRPQTMDQATNPPVGITPHPRAPIIPSTPPCMLPSKRLHTAHRIHASGTSRRS